MARQKRLRRPRIRVPVDLSSSSADQCRAAARAFSPGLTDEQLVAGLRELADTIERENAVKAVK
jgi:hypothetical protein